MELNRIIEGDALTVLKTMPSKLVQCAVTSIPYWGLRDYGEEGQLGLEATPEEYVAKMVEVFAEVWRVLRDDGTLWLNLGDSYATSGSGKGQDNSEKATGEPCDSFRDAKYLNQRNPKTAVSGLKPKDLCGIPWGVAFALQADGWYLRSDIIWSKPNPMPESVTDRPTKAHEYLFLLTKKAKYYYDADAIRENYSESRSWGKIGNVEKTYRGEGNLDKRFQYDGTGRNRRTVWEIATQPYPEAHFATFPEKLVEPCILAGSNDRACGICGAAWGRETEKGDIISSGGSTKGMRAQIGDESGILRKDNLNEKIAKESITLGFRPNCEHNNGDSRSVILDPFMGSGTVALVALKHGRDYIGIELKPDYIAMAMKRLKPLGNRPLPQQEILI